MYVESDEFGATTAFESLNDNYVALRCVALFANIFFLKKKKERGKRTTESRVDHTLKKASWCTLFLPRVKMDANLRTGERLLVSCRDPFFLFFFFFVEKKRTLLWNM